MASGGSDQNAEYALSKLLQMGTVAEYESEFVIHANRVTGESFSFASFAEASFEDERSTIASTKPKNSKSCTRSRILRKLLEKKGDETLIFSILESFTENKKTHICSLLANYLRKNCFSILNVKEAGNTKSPLSADTFGNSGVDESETSGPKTPAKEVVDNGNGSALIFLVGYDTGSEVVTGFPEEFQRGDVVDALSRVLEQKSSEKGVDSGSRRRDYTLFGASLFAFLNPGPVILLVEEYGIPDNISSRQHLEGKVVVKEWGMIHP
ncbi:hypothetical protein Tco_0817560 [Tanacetum coccineum]